MKEIKLTQGKVTLVDDEDFDELNKFRWCYTNGYATRRRSMGEEGRGHEFIHRRLTKEWTCDGLQAGEEAVIIHRDGDKLNNQRANLLKTSKRNRQQRMEPRGASGFKGVQHRRGKWTAHIGVEGKTLHLGHFTEKDDAARAYNEAARKYYPATATYNPGVGFPVIVQPVTQEVSGE